MRFRVLGPLRVESEGRNLALGGPRQRAVLAALLTAPNETLSRARLMELVWDEPNASAEANLRGYVWKLRAALREPDDDAPRILWDQGFRLRVEPGELDLWEFEQHTDQALRDRGEGRLADAAAAFGRALAPVGGEPFQDVDASTRFEALRAALRERHEHVVEQYVALRMDLGGHAELVGELRSRHAQHPLWEHLAAQLMLALARSGKRGEALTVFRDTRTALIDALGTEPDRELQDMHQRVLHGDTRSEEPPQPAAASTAPVDQLPFDLGAFTGREPELALLDTLRRPDAGTIAIVSGPAGVGKTSIAVHWAHRAADAHPDGRLYIDLRGFTPGEPALDPGEVLRRFLAALGIPAEAIPGDTEQRAARFRALLADKRMLIVLDNAHDPAQVRPLLPGAAGCRTIVTSRNRLTGLIASTGALVVPVETMTDAQSRSLLAARLGPARLNGEPEAVQRILDACAGLPLALAVLTARAATRPGDPLAILADELDGDASPLDGLSGDDPATDLRTLLRWSYGQLSAEAARLLRLLGLHPGPDCSTAAAAGLAGIGIDRTRAALAELVEANLLRRKQGHRYVFHDLLRAFAAELAATDNGQEAAHRLLDFYLHTAYAANRLTDPNRDPIPLAPALPGVAPVRPNDDKQAMAWFETEGAVLLAAVKFAADRGFDTHCWQLAWSLRDYLDRGSWNDQATVWETALDAARRLDDAAAQARVNRLLAEAYRQLGRVEDAHALLDRSLLLCQVLNDEVGEAHAHHLHARFWTRQGRVPEAIDSNQRALDLYRAAGHSVGQANALNSIGWCHSLNGDHRTALAYCEQAMALLEESGDRHGQAATSDSLGYVHHHLGQHAQAIAHYRHALDLYRDLGSRSGEALTFDNLGDTHHAIGDREAARLAWRQALAIFEELSHTDAEDVRAKLGEADGSHEAFPAP